METQQLDELGLLVVDEAHMLGDTGRGYLLELALVKLRYLCPSLQIVCMSATLSNVAEVATWLQAELYTSDFRPVPLAQRSSVRKVDLTSGKVVHHEAMESRLFGEGMCAWKDTYLVLTWREHVGHVYDKKSLKKLSEFTYTTEGWGVTHDGTRVVMTDGSTNLYWFDPSTMTLVETMPVTFNGKPVPRLNELEYINGEIWANVWFDTRIARINPTSGRVVGWIELKNILPGFPHGNDDVLNGIAYNSENDRLFVTGKLWPKLFEIRVKV